MKKTILFLLLNVLFINTEAQNWEWAIHENVNKFAVDSIGNVYTTCDTTIKRFHSNGTLSWQKQYSGDFGIKGMAADNSGNLYLVGNFTNFSIDGNQFNSLGSYDVFFCKVDSSGTLLWYKTFGSPTEDVASDMYISKNQKIYICGNAGAGAVIGSTAFTVPEFFVTRYDINGNQELLINKYGVEAWEVSSDTSGNIFMVCGITDTLNFGNGIILPPCDPGCPALNYFIVKYNATGTFIWAKDCGIAYYTPYEYLATDNKGNFYLTQWIRYGGFDLNRFDANGNLVWSKSMGGLYGGCSSLSIDNNNFVWLTGYSWDDDGTGNNLKNESFIWEFDPSNNLTQITH